MKLHHIAALATLAALAAGPGFALTYNCKMTRNDPSGWVPKQVVINYNPGTGKAQVFDPIIKHFVGNPITAVVDIDNAKRVTFKWQVQSTNRTAQFTKMSYRATVRKGSNAISVSGKPLGYVNNYSSSGACTLRK